MQQAIQAWDGNGIQTMKSSTFNKMNHCATTSRDKGCPGDLFNKIKCVSSKSRSFWTFILVLEQLLPLCVTSQLARFDCVSGASILYCLWLERFVRQSSSGNLSEQSFRRRQTIVNHFSCFGDILTSCDAKCHCLVFLNFNLHIVLLTQSNKITPKLLPWACEVLPVASARLNSL